MEMDHIITSVVEIMQQFNCKSSNKNQVSWQYDRKDSTQSLESKKVGNITLTFKGDLFEIVETLAEKVIHDLLETLIQKPKKSCI